MRPIETPAEVGRRGARWTRVARVAVALLLVGGLAWKAGVGQLEAKDISWGYVAGALLVVPFSIFVRAYNHWLLLNRSTRILSLRQAVLLTLAGVGFNLFVPTGAADLIKAHWGWRMHGNAEAMVISSVLDKLTSLTALAAIGAIGSVVAGAPVLAWVALAVGLASVAPLVAPGIVPWRLVLRFLAPGAAIEDAAVMASSRPPLALLLWVYAVSAGAWMLTYLAMWLSCLAVRAMVTPSQVLAFAPMSSLARLLPVSIGGLGVGEVTMAALLGRAGVPPEIAARAVLVSMLLLIVAPGAMGAIVVARGGRARDSEAFPRD